MDALVRKAVPADAESIAQVHIRSWQAAYRSQLPDHFLNGLDQELAARAEFWRTEISAPRSPKHEIWVAGTDARVEGFVALGPERHADPAGEIYAIYVNPTAGIRVWAALSLPGPLRVSSPLYIPEQFCGCLNPTLALGDSMNSPDGLSTTKLKSKAFLVACNSKR